MSIELGETFAESPPFNLESAYDDSTNITPLIFVLSPGADVNDYLIDLAKKKVMARNQSLAGRWQRLQYHNCNAVG